MRNTLTAASGTAKFPMGKTKFNEGYAEYTLANRLTNHLLHKPGERAEVDWSGPTMALRGHDHRRNNHCISVCRHPSLQPVLLCGALPGYENGHLYFDAIPVCMNTLAVCQSGRYVIT